MKQQQHSPVHDGFQPAAPHATPHTHISHTFGREPLTKGFGRVAGGVRIGQKENGSLVSRLAVNPVVEGGEAQKTARGELLLAVLHVSLSEYIVNVVKLMSIPNWSLHLRTKWHFQWHRTQHQVYEYN